MTHFSRIHAVPRSVTPEAFCRLMKNLPVIDVRSPAEFLSGHIPGAVNIPLFSNEERALVGTAYVREGPDEAISVGEKLAWSRTSFYDEKVREVVGGNSFLMYCWRGGLRSAGMAGYYESKGFTVTLLQGGYKGFRKYIRQQFVQPHSMFLLGGYTGTGKTEILLHLQHSGNQVIDLEKLACHKGSAFGHLGEQKQPSTEHFENLLFWQWQALNPEKPLWLEHESLSIGSVFLPDTLYSAMKQAPLLLLQIPVEERIKRIVADYSGYPPGHLEQAIQHIRMRLGTLQTKTALAFLYKGEFEKVAEILLVYYDKLYQYALEKWPKEKIIFIKSSTGDATTNAARLIHYVKDMESNSCK